LNNSVNPRSGNAALLWLGYLLFVVYGSLVPLEFAARPLTDAWISFQAMPYLQLGVESRADWVANGVLYVPLAFLTLHMLANALPKLPRAVHLVIAGLFAATVAVGIEFGQLFFPPRTVSRNDLIAEVLGTAVGLGLYLLLADWYRAMWASFGALQRHWGRRLLEAYAVAYVAFMFFPFDLLLTQAELASKAASGRWGWLLADVARAPALVSMKSLAELVLTLPFGFLLAQRTSGRAIGLGGAALAGCALGLLIELGQFFIASGVSQGLSILTRALGMACGYLIAVDPARRAARASLPAIRRHLWLLAPVYLLLLLGVNGWLTGNWHGTQEAAAQWAGLRLVPFYYHYFTSEARALFSVMAVAASYLPVAAMCWAGEQSRGRAAIITMGLAAVVEGGKLFLTGVRPDPTNPLIAAAAVYLVMGLLAPWSAVDAAPAAGYGNSIHIGRRSRAWLVWLVPCLAGALYGAVTFPSFPMLLSLLLLACAVAVWVRPAAALVIIPAALPVLDLAPWSGRFFWDEFDLLLLVVLAIGLARTPAVGPAARRPDPVLRLLTVVLFVSFTVSALRGLWPLPWPDANAFNNYYSPYNALRIVKGAVWALLAVVLARRLLAVGVALRLAVTWGMALGLSLTIAVVLWERVAFSGLWNFSDGYRVTGPFSAIHTGGAYIECFLAAATAFLLSLLIEKRNLVLRAAGVALLLATTYALMVTFSRNGYTALGVAVLIVAVTAVRQARSRVKSGFLVLMLMGAMVAVAIPVFKADYTQARMALVSRDLGIRAAQWKDALHMRDEDWATATFGMGIGRFPETSFWRSSYNRASGTYRLLQDADNTFLRLTAGDSLYLEQMVPVRPGQEYVLRLDVRASRANQNLSVPICEKWMLTSYNCVWIAIDTGKEFGTWRTIERRLTTKQLMVSPWYSQRTVKFSFYFANLGATMDIDNVHLVTAQGKELLQNGDFSSKLDHWFFSTDGHLQWHVKNLFVGVLFDQGWLGLWALAALTALALTRAARRTMHGDMDAGVMLAALGSFLVVGIFDTLVDSPRYLFLLILLLWACAYRPNPAAAIALER